MTENVDMDTDDTSGEDISTSNSVSALTTRSHDTLISKSVSVMEEAPSNPTS
jgi:hypothetical protein